MRTCPHILTSLDLDLVLLLEEHDTQITRMSTNKKIFEDLWSSANPGEI